MSDWRRRLSSHSFIFLGVYAEQRLRWKEWVEKAITRVRAEQAKPNGDIQAPSLLVEILTREGRIQEAWDEAEGGFCAPQVWLSLADASVEPHPANAAGVYVRVAEQELRGKGT